MRGVTQCYLVPLLHALLFFSSSQLIPTCIFFVQLPNATAKDISGHLLFSQSHRMPVVWRRVHVFTSFIVPELQPSHCVVKLLNDVSCGFGDTVDVLLNPPREVFMCVNVASPHCESCTVKKNKLLWLYYIWAIIKKNMEEHQPFLHHKPFFFFPV